MVFLIVIRSLNSSSSRSIEDAFGAGAAGEAGAVRQAKIIIVQVN